MKLFLVIALAVLLTPLATAQKAPRNRALATHHTIKVGKGLKKMAHGVAKVTVVTVLGAYDSLEASVDAFGVSLQAFADALDIGVAAPLESLPKPLNEIGVGVHYVYEGLDAAGQFLAE